MGTGGGKEQQGSEFGTVLQLEREKVQVSTLEVWGTI